MALSWFICQYKLKAGPGGLLNTRYCAMDDFTPQIVADGGAWSETEVLGGYAVVKVRAAASTLTTIGNATGYTRIPNHVNLNDTLGDLTATQRTRLVNLIDAMGYTPAELAAALGVNLAAWRTKTLRQVLIFIAQRRLKPRWDEIQGQIVLDGILQACRPIAEVDTEVQ